MAVLNVSQKAFWIFLKNESFANGRRIERKLIVLQLSSRTKESQATLFLEQILFVGSFIAMDKTHSLDLTSLQLRYRIEIMINIAINITDDSVNAPILAAPSSRWFIARSNKENGVR